MAAVVKATLVLAGIAFPWAKPGRGEGLRGHPADRFERRSRVIAGTLVAAAHVLLICVLLGRIFDHPASHAPVVEPIVVSLIDRAWQPPVPSPLRVAIRPQVARPQVAFPRIPALRLAVPTEPVPSAGSKAPAVGSPGRRGPIDETGATLTIVHYVAPAYPSQASHEGEHGSISLEVLINSHGAVDAVEVLHGTGFRLLNEAAVRAVRQWRFAPLARGSGVRPLRGKVTIVFAPPQRLVGVPVMLMPYVAVAHELQVALSRKHHSYSPLARWSLPRLIRRLIVTDSSRSGHGSAAGPQSPGSLETQLADFGPLLSVKFLCLLPHGVDIDDSGPADLPRPVYWEAYRVEQKRRTTVWLVAATPSGSIQRIEVAMQ